MRWQFWQGASVVGNENAEHENSLFGEFGWKAAPVANALVVSLTHVFIPFHLMFAPDSLLNGSYPFFMFIGLHLMAIGSALYHGRKRTSLKPDPITSHIYWNTKGTSHLTVIKIRA